MNLKLPLILLALATLHTAAGEGCRTVQDVLQADKLWQTSMATQQANQVASLYATDAVLIATFENKPLTTSQERLAYFQHLIQSLPDIRVQYQQEIVQLLPGGAVSAGLYTFKGTKSGEQTEIPARFTFVYKTTPQGCQLIHHHSSQLPKTD